MVLKIIFGGYDWKVHRYFNFSKLVLIYAFWGCFSHICERDHSHVSSCDYDLLSSMQIAFILPLLELSCCLVFSMTGLHSKLVVPFLIPWIFLAIHRLRL